MAKNRETAPKIVNHELTKKALAKAVCDGDIVNFRLVFMPFSPARLDSSQRFETDKYAYLLPDEEQEGRSEFQEALRAVQEAATWEHIQRELEADRPPQLPSQLLLPLADHAVRTGKYTSAAQAYEMLRIRGRMQEEFLNQSDAFLKDGVPTENIQKGVRGYLIAAELGYDYAAFPEPLPIVPDFQTRALMLHGEYPQDPDDCVARQETDGFLRTAFAYLLLDAEIAARLDELPRETRIAFLKALVRQRDPEWDVFTHHYRQACQTLETFRKRFEKAAHSGSGLAEEIAHELGEDPHEIPASLLGRTVEEGEWWQYLKELAFKHPASVLFVARQLYGESEILVPRYRADSPIPRELGLTSESSGAHE